MLTNTCMDETSRLLQKLKSIDPESLAQAHDEMITGFDEKGNPIAEGDATFEIDNKLHRVPFEKLREALQKSNPVSTMPDTESFRGRIPKGIAQSIKINPSMDSVNTGTKDHDNDDSYYWDKNYNYEYMHPEAVKDRVLGKIKK